MFSALFGWRIGEEDNEVIIFEADGALPEMAKQ